MLIWLPPSEGKTSPDSGPRLDLGKLLFPELNDARQEVIAALQALGDGPEAARTLKLGPKSSAEASQNLVLRIAPCAPAISLYTGVLYDNLDAPTLSDAGRRVLEDRTWILSALFGFVRPMDLIPGHRLSMGTKVPGLGAMAPWWRPRLHAVMPPLEGETILDCRPGAYRSAYPAPQADLLDLAVAEERDGVRRIVTHMSKKWRGMAVRHLVEDPALPSEGDSAAILTSLETLQDADEDVVGIEVDQTSRNAAGGSVTRITLVTRAAC